MNNTDTFIWTPEKLSEYYNWCDTVKSNPSLDSMERFKEQVMEQSSPTLSKPMLVTEDGVEITDNETEIWGVSQSMQKNYSVRAKDINRYPKDFKFFSTHQLAQDYITLHSKSLSLAEHYERVEKALDTMPKYLMYDQFRKDFINALKQSKQ